MTKTCTGSPCHPLIVNSRTSPSACRASSARFSDSIGRAPLPSPRAREERRRMTRRGARERQHAAVARAREARDAAARHDAASGCAAASGNRYSPTRPRSSARNSSAPNRELHCTCIAARSNFGASARIAPPRRAQQRQVPLVVERAVGVAGTEDEPLAVRRIDRRRVVGAGRRGQHVLAARGEIDGHDVALVHEVRLGGQVGGDRQLPPIRRDVEVLRRRLPRRQRELRGLPAGPRCVRCARRTRTRAARGRRSPSDPNSAWRARSVTCAFTLESWRSFRRLPCAASVFKSGQTQTRTRCGGCRETT